MSGRRAVSPKSRLKQTLRENIHPRAIRYNRCGMPCLSLIAIRQLGGERRGSQLRERVHYPVTTSSKEWADELLALDQMIVEGFVATELRKFAVAANVKIDTSWGSLKLLQEYSGQG